MAGTKQPDSAGKAGGNIRVGDIGNASQIVNPTPPPPLSLHQIPAPPADFTGRAAELAQLLDGFGAGAAISGVRGLGGVGKTALALALAERLRADFPDASFLVDMQGTAATPKPPAQALAEIIHALHPEAKLPDDLATLRGLYHSVLQGQRALILLDNAADHAQVAPFCPPSAGCALLITSRRKIALAGLHPLDLNSLPLSAAADLLSAIAGGRLGLRGRADLGWEAVARLCGCLPLALRAAGSLLASSPDLSLKDYAAALGDERTRLEKIGGESVEMDVEASFNLSYARLPAATAQVFRRLAVFPADFDAAAAAAVCATGDRPGPFAALKSFFRRDRGHDYTQNASNILSELLCYSMVEYTAATPEPTSGRYRLHDLARLFAAARLTDDERAAAQACHAQHYAVVYGAATSNYMQGGNGILAGLALFDKEWFNIQAGQGWAAQNIDSDDTAASLCTAYVNWPFLLDLRLRPRQCVGWLDAALAASRRRGDRASEGIHLGNLGNNYRLLGETRRAIEYYEKALVIRREIGDRRGEGNDLGNLGNAYADLGETRRAIEYYEKRIVIAHETGDRRGEGAALSNMGIAYHVLGETRRAIGYNERALAILREIGDRRGEGSTLENLGEAYLALGEFGRATGFLEQSLEICRAIGDRRQEAECLYVMSQALDRLSERERAITFAEQALAIKEQIDDPSAKKVRQALAAWRGAPSS